MASDKRACEPGRDNLHFSGGALAVVPRSLNHRQYRGRGDRHTDSGSGYGLNRNWGERGLHEIRIDDVCAPAAGAIGLTATGDHAADVTWEADICQSEEA
jgi:hypothetical protein